VLWRQGLTEAGDLTQPQIVGHYLIFSGSRAGLFVVERDGGALLEVFNPGHGICAAPTLDARNGRIYVLANGGSLYALDLTCPGRAAAAAPPIASMRRTSSLIRRVPPASRAFHSMPKPCSPPG